MLKVTDQKGIMTDSPTAQQPSPDSPSDDLFLGETTGVVVAFYHVHGFIRTVDFGEIFVHVSKLPDGLTDLKIGQHVHFHISKGARGRYAHEVQILNEGAIDPSEVFTPTKSARVLNKEEIAIIAHRLGENNPYVISQISRLFYHFGSDVIKEILAETEQIETGDGMLLPDGSRRRTPGGVFFFLAKKRLSPDDSARIFSSQFAQKKRKQDGPPQESAATPRTPTPAPAPVIVVTWEMRGPLINEARVGQGKATTVKVTVIGRPTSVVERGNTVILMLTYTGPLPSMPKGVPIPTVVPPTTYVVYVSAKQWRGVAAAIQDPEDVLIIEGAQAWDAEQKAIAVYTTKISTKLQQRAKRPAPPAEQPPPA